MDKLIKELLDITPEEFLDRVVDAVNSGLDQDEDFGMVEFIDKNTIVKGHPIKNLVSLDITEITRELNRSGWIEDNIETIEARVGKKIGELKFNIVKFSNRSCGLEIYFE